MRHIVICGLPGCTVFFHVISWTVRFSGGKLLNTKCVFRFSLQLRSETFLIIRRNERDMIEMYVGLHVKYPLFSSDCSETWILSTDFGTNTQIQNFMEIRPVGTEFCADVDVTKLRVAFRSYANATKKALLSCCDASGSRNGDSTRLPVSLEWPCRWKYWILMESYCVALRFCSPQIPHVLSPHWPLAAADPNCT